MPTVNDLLKTIEQSDQKSSLKSILETHPTLARRTAQRWLKQLVEDSRIAAEGQGPSRVYSTVAHKIVVDVAHDRYPSYIPLSADSRDILNYIDQPLEARRPVGYDRSFLEEYEPNKTFYLSEPLRRQLYKMGDTQQTQLPVGTYGRAILNRLLIDLSWASSNLEGNTYSRLDTRELIEHGNAASGKATIETQMILNHKAAIELLVESINQVGFNRFTLLNLHSLLSENLLPNPSDEGRVRQHIVEIGNDRIDRYIGFCLIGYLMGMYILKSLHPKNRNSDSDRINGYIEFCLVRYLMSISILKSLRPINPNADNELK